MVSTSGRGSRQLAGYPLPMWLLGLGCFINVGGLSLLWPVNSIYIHGQLHQSMAVAGLVLTIYSGAGFVGSFLGGWLYDRFGAMKVLTTAILLASATIVLPAFTHAWSIYVAVMCVFGVTCAVPSPILNALAGHMWPAGGRRAFNFLYVATNLGVALGTAIGGLLAQLSFAGVFLGIAASNMVLMAFIWTGLRQPVRQLHDSLHAAKQGKVHGTSVRTPLPWGALGLLLIGFVLAWSVYVQWQSTVSVDMQGLGYPLSAYSLLWTMNGLLIFLTQPLVAWGVRRVPQLPLQMIGGTLLYAISFALLLISHRYGVFVVAMVTTTLGEIFAWPAVPAAVAKLAPPDRLGMLQGLVASAATFGRMVGPLWGGIVYDAGGIHTVLLCGLCLLILPLLLFALYQRLTRPQPGELDAYPAHHSS